MAYLDSVPAPESILNYITDCLFFEISMIKHHKIEIFSAGCPCCKNAIEMVRSVAGNKDKVILLDMTEPSVTERAKKLGIRSVPAVLIDGKLADCCSNRGPDRIVIQSALKH